MTIDIDQPDIIWDEIEKKYRAYLFMNGRHQFLGYFQSFDDACMARTQSAWCFVEEFAKQL